MKKKKKKLIKPNVIIEDQNLNAAGFIQFGKRSILPFFLVFRKMKNNKKKLKFSQFKV